MLETLSIQNVALISDAKIEFEKGLNVLTGETGAGKSILIDSIGLLLGDRCDKTLIRNGEDQCKIIGTWSIENNIKPAIKEFCNKYDLEEFEELIISRVCTSEGKSSAKINGFPATIGMLKELTSILVDTYGQNENWSVFNPNNHLKILDNYAKIQNSDAYVDYIKSHQTLKELNNQLRTFGGTEEERLKELEFLSFQISEIDNSKISCEEYENLLNEKKRLNNLGKIANCTNDAEAYMSSNIVDNLKRAENNLFSASQFDAEIGELAERVSSLKIEFQDVLDSLGKYNQSLDFSESEQDRIESRLDEYHTLFRKYGQNVEQVTAYLNTAQAQYDMLNNATEQIAKLQKQKNEVLQNLFNLAKELHSIREKFASELCAKTLNNLKLLEMPNAKLSFKFNTPILIENNLLSNGYDVAELMFSANLGEPEKPLNKIASGGEISRFMLALKSVIADVDNMPTMIFDEIDTGISGVTSEAMAKQMATISKNHQIIVVTHSQHITAMADHNYFISKSTINGKTFTSIKKLTYGEKINEVARFMSGSEINQSAINNAKTMIEEQEAFKKSL